MISYLFSNFEENARDTYSEEQKPVPVWIHKHTEAYFHLRNQARCCLVVPAYLHQEGKECGTR